jgi:hypothetical protein
MRRRVVNVTGYTKKGTWKMSDSAGNFFFPLKDNNRHFKWKNNLKFKKSPLEKFFLFQPSFPFLLLFAFFSMISKPE